MPFSAKFYYLKKRNSSCTATSYDIFTRGNSIIHPQSDLCFPEEAAPNYPSTHTTHHILCHGSSTLCSSNLVNGQHLAPLCNTAQLVEWYCGMPSRLFSREELGQPGRASSPPEEGSAWFELNRPTTFLVVDMEGITEVSIVSPRSVSSLSRHSQIRKAGLLEKTKYTFMRNLQIEVEA